MKCNTGKVAEESSNTGNTSQGANNTGSIPVTHDMFKDLLHSKPTQVTITHHPTTTTKVVGHTPNGLPIVATITHPNTATAQQLYNNGMLGNFYSVIYRISYLPYCVA